MWTKAHVYGASGGDYWGKTTMLNSIMVCFPKNCDASVNWVNAEQHGV
jgi:hypothetical protein